MTVFDTKLPGVSYVMLSGFGSIGSISIVLGIQMCACLTRAH